MQKKTVKKNFLYIIIATLLVITLAGRSLAAVEVAPFHAFGGAVWFKEGVHYLSDDQLSTRVKQMNAPVELALAEQISQATPLCDTVESGFCQQSPSIYLDKTLVTSAVAYVPAVPDTKKIIGYCTVCNDGTWSPSCAVGRGACSWHGGVAAYNVAQYITISGTPAVLAQPATYSYNTKTYKDSLIYSKPATPSLNDIFTFAN